ncbi:hypothetical protein LX32DRAFT_648449 [Colletotrichum zoysiae]|uniref:Uncharacterized protein n=1 Tax=Colletotrichum zoysiae TaxID=1216348 RepID=A0AAD9HV50_9PEZI|nr:hypothetical protein LX32DRAFT_648449 [Colletotrichum zoysiae]
MADSLGLQQKLLTPKERIDEINVRRAELDTLEQQARQDFLQEDWNIHAKLGSDLKVAVVNAEVAQDKEEEEDTDDHEERAASAVGLFACLRYLFMLCRRYHR